MSADIVADDYNNFLFLVIPALPPFSAILSNIIPILGRCTKARACRGLLSWYNRIMRKTFYFYDLETSGLKSRTDRIMQFAGIRTDENFQPVGEPTNLFVELPDDTLPSPGAVMVTGIAPMATRTDGISERDFCRFLTEEVALPGTTIMGYNSVRFDDEFIRNALWRNFHDPYEWHWRDGRSRWDLLDVVRMTRALRPDGIKWPVTDEGKPTNRLELITKENQIAHEHAHDALSDVEALISVTKLIKEQQPQLFDFLYKMRDKEAVMKVVNLENPQPFVYSSGRYGAEHNFTTVAYPIADAGKGQILVYDLRYNLSELLKQEKQAKAVGDIDKDKPWQAREPWEREYFPIVKKLQYNHCPAVAPIGVLEKDDGWARIELDKATIEKNLTDLKRHPEFIRRMASLADRKYPAERDVEQQIYEQFTSRADMNICAVVRANEGAELAHFKPKFKDERLNRLLIHYKARNFPSVLDENESQIWQEYRRERLEKSAPGFLKELAIIRQELDKGKTRGGREPKECEYLLEELQLWYQSLQESE